MQVWPTLTCDTPSSLSCYRARRREYYSFIVFLPGQSISQCLHERDDAFSLESGRRMINGRLTRALKRWPKEKYPLTVFFIFQYIICNSLTFYPSVTLSSHSLSKYECLSLIKESLCWSNSINWYTCWGCNYITVSTAKPKRVHFIPSSPLCLFLFSLSSWLPFTRLRGHHKGNPKYFLSYTWNKNAQRSCVCMFLFFLLHFSLRLQWGGERRRGQREREQRGEESQERMTDFDQRGAGVASCSLCWQGLFFSFFLAFTNTSWGVFFFSMQPDNVGAVDRSASFFIFILERKRFWL